MKKVMVKSVVGLMAMALIAGCAGGGGGASDEDQIAAVVASWQASMIAQDVDKMLATFSEKFSNYEMSDKEALREFAEGAIDMGYLDDAEFWMDDAETEIEGTTATIYPIDFAGAAGEVTFELVLTKEASGWLITGMEIEGL